MKLITRFNMKKSFLVIITTLLVSCGGVSNCNVDDNKVIQHVIDDLSLTRVLPLHFKPQKDVIDLCNNYKANLIGCTNNYKSYVFEELKGYWRVNIIAHEIYHQKDIENLLSTNGLVFHPLPESEAIAYGKKIADRLCN